MENHGIYRKKLVLFLETNSAVPNYFDSECADVVNDGETKAKVRTEKLTKKYVVRFLNYAD